MNARRIINRLDKAKLIWATTGRSWTPLGPLTRPRHSLRTCRQRPPSPTTPAARVRLSSPQAALRPQAACWRRPDGHRLAWQFAGLALVVPLLASFVAHPVRPHHDQ